MAKSNPKRRSKPDSRLVELHAISGKHDLLWYHDVGQRLNEMKQQLGKAAAYGNQFFTKIAVSLDKRARYRDELCKASEFAAQYRSRAKIAKLSRSLTWSHMLYLLSIEDKKERNEWQQRCIDEELPFRRFRRLINLERESKKGIGGMMSVPSDAVDALQTMIEDSNRWLRRCRVVFTGDGAFYSVGRRRRNQNETLGLATEVRGLFEQIIANAGNAIRMLPPPARRRRGA